jgi:hypothetical protein
MPKADNYLPTSAEPEAEQAKQNEESDAGVRGGAAASGHQEDVRTQSYATDRLDSIDSGRTDLRALDDHGSWRAVAHACHVDPDGHE